MASPSLSQGAASDPADRDQPGDRPATGPIPPRTPFEQAVHGIWTDLLSDVPGVPEFGVHDDFFELGGHSLLAPKIVARIRKTLGVQIAVREFFGYRTVAGLAMIAADRATGGLRVIEHRPDQDHYAL